MTPPSATLAGPSVAPPAGPSPAPADASSTPSIPATSPSTPAITASVPAGAVPVPAGPAVDSAGRPIAGGLLALVALLLIALNLRAAITSLGALLGEVRTGLQLSGAIAGLITTLPTIAFAGFGALTPWLVRRYAPARVLATAMVALTAGQLLRASTDSAAVFLATSALALAGIAVANILLPMLVKQYFAHRTGLVTGAYTMALTVGSTVAAAAAVPVAHAAGSWRAGLGAWALLAALAVLPLIPLALRRGRPKLLDRSPSAARVRPSRTRLGWAMAAYFGMQSLSGYAIMGWLAQLFRDAGYRPETAGLLLAGVTAMGVPLALAMATLVARVRTLHAVVATLSTASAVAYLGLAIAPHDGALLWVPLLAVGQAAFPLILATIGLRARTPAGTVALSAFAQSTGYLVAALGPLLVGLLYSATGGWTAPIALLLGALAVQTTAGFAIARPRFVEDE
ncbi:MFS transporter [Plantactinospora sp. GCM10030261]|uniref:MFS transporter n=1 Tax=Plantactinospora sp. GCM10030261 TaxID=3273420 RepID=UPI003617E06B